MSAGSGIASIDLKVTYDTAVFSNAGDPQAVGPTVSPGILSKATAGSVTISYVATPGKLIAGPADIVKIPMAVAVGATPSAGSLKLESASFGDDNGAEMAGVKATIQFVCN